MKLKASSYMVMFLAVTSLLCSCSKKEEEAEEVKDTLITDLPKDLKIPLKTWDMLAGVSEHSEAKKEEKAAEEKAPEKEGSKESAVDNSYVFSTLKVILTEKNPGIVKEKTLTISLPRGGGELDLAHYLTGKMGSFFVRFEYPEWEEAKEKKVLFISHARKRKIDDQIYGAGCKQIYNITDHFMKEMTKEGLKVNTTRNRHTSVLAGTFILYAKKAGQNYLTQVTFTDSTNPHLLCQEH